MAKTYSPKKVRVIYGGVVMTGYMDGTFVEVDKTTDDFTEIVGSDGEGARIASADESGTVTITLMQTSASNDYLSNMRIKDKQTNLNTAALTVEDGSGRTLCEATEAWIKKVAKVEMSNDKTGRAWVFASTDLRHYVGGNG